MAGKALTTAATMTCPHGGTVTAMSSGRVTATAPVLRATDTFLIAGCSFSTAAGPMPCVTVRWVSPDTRVKASGAATLSEGSIGLCLNGGNAPQGTVSVLMTQPHASTV